MVIPVEDRIQGIDGLEVHFDLNAPPNGVLGRFRITRFGKTPLDLLAYPGFSVVQGIGPVPEIGKHPKNAVRFLRIHPERSFRLAVFDPPDFLDKVVTRKSFRAKNEPYPLVIALGCQIGAFKTKILKGRVLGGKLLACHAERCERLDTAHTGPGLLVRLIKYFHAALQHPLGFIQDRFRIVGSVRYFQPGTDLIFKSQSQFERCGHTIPVLQPVVFCVVFSVAGF